MQDPTWKGKKLVPRDITQLSKTTQAWHSYGRGRKETDAPSFRAEHESWSPSLVME